MSRRMLFVVHVWPWVLALMILYPVLAPGYVLSYDMVFVPDLALRADFFGLGSGLPRAVPSDAVVAVLDEVIPGMILQKIILVMSLVLAGAGVRRLAPSDSGVAQLAAMSFYVWNPYVAERLVIGHWPVLLAYAALPWIVDFARRFRAGESVLPQLSLWLVFAAMSASSGTMAAAAALAFGLTLSGRPARRRSFLLVAVTVAANAPWIVAGLLHSSTALTDRAGVDLFAAGPEGKLPMIAAALGLGGIWNLEVVPDTRLGLLPMVSLVLVLVVGAFGVRQWLRWTGQGDAVRYVICAVVAITMAAVGTWIPEVLGWTVSHVPGGGLLRDGSRYLGLLAIGEVSVFAMGVAKLASAIHQQTARVAVVLGLALFPLAVLPDLAAGAAGRLTAVEFPAEYDEVRQEIDSLRASGVEGDVLVLPFSSYRAPQWNNGNKTLDPVGRYLTPNYLVNDDLYVSGKRVEGEDPRAREVSRILASQPGQVRDRLAHVGIGFVVVDRTSSGPAGYGYDGRLMDEMDRVFEGDRLSVVVIPGADLRRPPLSQLLVAWIAWGVFLVTIVCSLTQLARRQSFRELSAGLHMIFSRRESGGNTK